MRTIQLLEQEGVESMIAAEKAKGPLFELYKRVSQSIAESRGQRNFDALWARLAPTGNIYRYLGFRMEHSRHCGDLANQLSQLADKHKELLGGDQAMPEERAARLFKLLAQTTRRNDRFLEDGEEVKGFRPLEEFLGDPTVKVAGVNVPKDAAGRAQWRTDHLMAALVCLIQVVAPILVFVHNWYKEENQLRDPAKLFKSLTVSEAMCLGGDVSAQLTTLMGTMMLVVVNSIILNYAQAEQENAEKLGRIPLDNFWLLCSTVANANCCVFVTLAIPLEFWSEDGPTGIIMNAMALLFIFSFDDLSSDAFGYLGKDDATFQRELCWNYALLSHCPLQLGDVVNAEATQAEDLWQISYDGQGRLQKAGPDGGPCTTRLTLAAEGEASPLVTKGEEDVNLPETCYRVTPGGPVRRLPGWRNGLSTVIWTLVVLMLQVVWWVLPGVWFIVNKPCLDAAGATKVG
mmetsp:Transcript_14868/g.47517  ORF Transcript_14868/g.47517 Transcript_14868/m.47517 type:complete len:460 (-) Transcript_14868:61-1440(-)